MMDHSELKIDHILYRLLDHVVCVNLDRAFTDGVLNLLDRLFLFVTARWAARHTLRAWPTSSSKWQISPL